jgi:hypothetical protein
LCHWAIYSTLALKPYHLAHARPVSSLVWTVLKTAHHGAGVFFVTEVTQMPLSHAHYTHTKPHVACSVSPLKIRPQCPPHSNGPCLAGLIGDSMILTIICTVAISGTQLWNLSHTVQCTVHIATSNANATQPAILQISPVPVPCPRNSSSCCYLLLPLLLMLLYVPDVAYMLHVMLAGLGLPMEVRLLESGSLRKVKTMATWKVFMPICPSPWSFR